MRQVRGLLDKVLPALSMCRSATRLESREARAGCDPTLAPVCFVLWRSRSRSRSACGSSVHSSRTRRVSRSPDYRARSRSVSPGMLVLRARDTYASGSVPAFGLRVRHGRAVWPPRARLFIRAQARSPELIPCCLAAADSPCLRATAATRAGPGSPRQLLPLVLEGSCASCRSACACGHGRRCRDSCYLL